MRQTSKSAPGNGLIGMPVLSDDMTTKSSTNQLSMII